MENLLIYFLGHIIVFLFKNLMMTLVNGMQLKRHLRIGVCEPFSAISVHNIIIVGLHLSAKTLSIKKCCS